MGNTVVLKPATVTRLSALLFAEICAEAGLPPGVFNVVTGTYSRENQSWLLNFAFIIRRSNFGFFSMAGGGAMGQQLAEHPLVDKVGFTGSTEIGKVLKEAIAGTGKKISLELGGMR